MDGGADGCMTGLSLLAPQPWLRACFQERQSSGIAQELSGSGHHFVNGFAGDLEVQRVGA